MLGWKGTEGRISNPEYNDLCSSFDGLLNEHPTNNSNSNSNFLFVVGISLLCSFPNSRKKKILDPELRFRPRSVRWLRRSNESMLPRLLIRGHSRMQSRFLYLFIDPRSRHRTERASHSPAHSSKNRSGFYVYLPILTPPTQPATSPVSLNSSDSPWRNETKESLPSASNIPRLLV